MFAISSHVILFNTLLQQIIDESELQKENPAINPVLLKVCLYDYLYGQGLRVKIIYILVKYIEK